MKSIFIYLIMTLLLASCGNSNETPDTPITEIKKDSAVTQLPKERTKMGMVSNDTTKSSELKPNKTDYGIEMVFVKGGSFVMGCTSEQGSDCLIGEKPSHSVTLSSYSIGKYEITQAQWKAVMGNNPSENSGCDNCPVENVSWDGVQVFIKKLNKKAGKTYRLPAEAEWEYAARGGNKSKHYKYSGSNDIASVAWYNDLVFDDTNTKKTHVVGQKMPNELGIYDMSGNVYEWCCDEPVDYNSYSQSNSKGANRYGTSFVIRGGCWYHYANSCRSSFRSDRYHNSSYGGCDGFRLAL